MKTIGTFLEALEAAEPRPAPSGRQSDKKNYAERLSRQLAILLANHLRQHFPGIRPDPEGRQQETPARTGKGVKKLDVNYSTPELGLGLGVSIKTLNFPDPGTARYTKNYTRIDNELRAEAKDYHQRQPYAVLVGVVFLPYASCDDGEKKGTSSFAQAVRSFRWRTGRKNPRNEEEHLERIFVVLYEHQGEHRGEAVFFDVQSAPPQRGRPNPQRTLDVDGFVREVVRTYDDRNDTPFEWAKD